MQAGGERRHDPVTREKFIPGINFAKLKPPQDEESKSRETELEPRMKTEGESRRRWRGI